MSTPVILYTSAGMPIGGFAVIPMYRVTTASLTVNGTEIIAAPPVAAGGLAAGGTALGNFIFEKVALNMDGTLVQRMDAIGATADKTLIRKDPTLTCTIQIAGIGTPTLCPGDAFEEAIGYAGTSTTGAPVAAPVSRWFISKDGINYDPATPSQFTATFELDRQNSAASLPF